VWLHMTGLMLIGLVPFAAMGIAIGHLIAAESIGPVMGGSTALFAFLGGTWFPITGNGLLHQVAQDLPSYWLVQASHLAIGGSGWSTRAWVVLGAWTAAMLVVAARAYRRDTKRA